MSMRFTLSSLLPPIALLIVGYVLSGGRSDSAIAYVSISAALMWFVGGCVATLWYWIARAVRRGWGK